LTHAQAGFILRTAFEEGERAGIAMPRVAIAALNRE